MTDFDFDFVGRCFVAQFYPTFGTNRSQLGGVYRDSSLMTMQGKQLQGVGNIMCWFKQGITFSIARFETEAEDIDCHPSPDGGIIISVSGKVLVDDEKRPLKFSDMFYLSEDQGTWFVSNQIFQITGGVVDE
tara:strand:- start:113 stop:508 length:396 start_codon:yes stop_codon:yes gene_type:complete